MFIPQYIKTTDLLSRTRAFQSWWPMEIHSSIWTSTKLISTVIRFFQCFWVFPRCQEFVKSSLKTIWIQIYANDMWSNQNWRYPCIITWKRLYFGYKAMISIIPVNISSKLIVHYSPTEAFWPNYRPFNMGCMTDLQNIYSYSFHKTFRCEYISSVLPVLSLDH